MDRDRDLLEGLKAGDHAAFDGLFRRYQNRVYGFVAKMIGRDAAEDVTQEVFVEAYRSIGRFRERSTLKTWLFRIAVHVAHKHRRKRREETGLGDHAGREPADETVEASQRASRLEEAVQTLPDPMREAVLLNKILGFTYAECAQIAGCPIGTVKSRVANAMVRLRELLEAQERAD